MAHDIPHSLPRDPKRAWGQQTTEKNFSVNGGVWDPHKIDKPIWIFRTSEVHNFNVRVSDPTSAPNSEFQIWVSVMALGSGSGVRNPPTVRRMLGWSRGWFNQSHNQQRWAHGAEVEFEMNKFKRLNVIQVLSPLSQNLEQNWPFHT